MIRFLFIFLVAFPPMCLADESSHRDKIVELLTLTGVIEVAANGLKYLEDDLDKSVTEMYEGLTRQHGFPESIQVHLDEYRTQARKVIKELFSKEKILSQYVPIYMANFSEIEIDELLSFFSSDLGKEYLAKNISIQLQFKSLEDTRNQEYIDAMKPFQDKLKSQLKI